MTERTCSFTPCGMAAEYGRTLCGGHRCQQRRGEDLKPIDRRPARERFFENTRPEGDCIIWLGQPDDNGYGEMRINNRRARVHRLAYEFTHGEIPAGMVIDHMCHTRLCVNPDHLQPASNTMNAENRAGAQRNSKSGIRGVSWSKVSRKWVCYVHHNRKTYWVGAFADIRDAEHAVSEARRRMFTNSLMDE